MEVLLGGVVAAVVGALVTLWTQSRERSQRQRLLAQELEHQTREVLRRAYADLLVAQRRSRESSLGLAVAGGTAADQTLVETAISAHAEFLDRYHQLNLDSSREMWLEARGLRNALDDMLKLGQEGDAPACSAAAELARDARQNLEIRFRERLGYADLQRRRPLGKYDKVEPYSR
jgi:hypothetical protein